MNESNVGTTGPGVKADLSEVEVGRIARQTADRVRRIKVSLARARAIEDAMRSRHLTPADRLRVVVAIRELVPWV